jgi:hypothetical protein
MPTKVTGWKSARTGRVFDTKTECRKDENVLDLDKLARLYERIASGKPWMPEIGDYIYVETSMYIDHGEDDVVGGLAQVTEVVPSMSGGNPNCLFVSFAQYPGSRNWSQWLVNKQAELKKRFGNEFAYPDPDY